MNVFVLKSLTCSVLGKVVLKHQNFNEFLFSLQTQEGRRKGNSGQTCKVGHY